MVIYVLINLAFSIIIVWSSVGLLTRIQESEDKGVCTRALWCLAKQNLDGVIMKAKV